MHRQRVRLRWLRGLDGYVNSACREHSADQYDYTEWYQLRTYLTLRPLSVWVQEVVGDRPERVSQQQRAS